MSPGVKPFVGKVVSQNSAGRGKAQHKHAIDPPETGLMIFETSWTFAQEDGNNPKALRLATGSFGFVSIGGDDHAQTEM